MDLTAWQSRLPCLYILEVCSQEESHRLVCIFYIHVTDTYVFIAWGTHQSTDEYRFIWTFHNECGQRTTNNVDFVLWGHCDHFVLPIPVLRICNPHEIGAQTTARKTRE